MRNGWEYKKLGDYIKEYSIKNKSGQNIPVYSVTNSQGLCKEYFSKEVASQDKTSYKIVPYGYFAYNPSRINVGSIDWQHKEEKVIVSPLYNVFSVSESILQPYLLYFLKSPATIKYIDTIATGTVRLNLKLSMLKDFTLPIPSILTQHTIVSELDKINELIRLKKEQLVEYDNLAQSIFYEMFGDPVENEKGWEVKKLIDVCTKITDGTHDTPQRLTEGIKFITGKHIRPGYIDYMNSDYVTEQVHKEIYARCNPEFGDVLYTNIGANLANAAINTVHYEFSMKNVALLKLRKDVIHGMLLQFYLNNPRIREKILENYSNGGAQKFLSLKSIALIKTILPPLPLQQSFASRIEQIEKLKSEVQNAITDLETLLASRMQYWFE